MKVVMCIAGQKIAPDILSKLSDKNYRITQLASKGGFMKRGNATYLVGVEDDEVSDVLNLVKELGEQYEHTSSAYRALAIVLNAEAGASYLHTDEHITQ